MFEIVPTSTLPCLVLIRGLPGTDKTTMAQSYISKGYQYFEADQFFMQSGECRFDNERLSEANVWCLEQTRKALLQQGAHVCVANVFAAIEDIKPYTEFGVEYEIVEAKHADQSSYRVPAATLAWMNRRWVTTEQIFKGLRTDSDRFPPKPITVSMNDGLPDLTFPDQSYGKWETPWDLRRLLYRGGAGTNVRIVDKKIESGELGEPLFERIGLVQQMHEQIANALGRGMRRATVASYIEGIRYFFVWVDETEKKVDFESVERTYQLWTDALFNRVRVGAGLGEDTAYGYGFRVGWVLDRVLRRPSLIIRTTRLRKPRRGTRAESFKANKLSLEGAFEFGRFLLDLADGLNLEAIWGALPVVIPLRNGLVLEEWSGFKSPSTLRTANPKYLSQSKYAAKQSDMRRMAWEADRTLRTRYTLINLRIQAEMHMLMGQPAINLAQAYQLRMDQWKFKPSTHGFEVRTYKHRRWGPVAFEIYSEYRRVFERYLEWRAAIFPDDPDGLLFPLIRKGRLEELPPCFSMLKERCERVGINYISPQRLRNTHVNWMLRRTGDPQLTADEKQHSVKTLLGSYEKPSRQRAMVQVKLHWANADPAQLAAGLGSCMSKVPESIPDIPSTATKPDCMTPAGCLFCVHQRDIDSQDHVWSLATYRLLKSFELAAHRLPDSKKKQIEHPAEVAIDRLTAKLAFIKASSSEREVWVSEALMRVEEGRYHPDWAAMIDDGRNGKLL